MNDHELKYNPDFEETGEENVSDYIFKRYEEYRDKCDALEEENRRLRNNELRNGNTCSAGGMTDFQFKHIIETLDKVNQLTRKNEELFHLVKTSVEAGKSPQEILAAIESLRNGSGD